MTINIQDWTPLLLTILGVILAETIKYFVVEFWVEADERLDDEGFFNRILDKVIKKPP